MSSPETSQKEAGPLQGHLRKHIALVEERIKNRPIPEAPPKSESWFSVFRMARETAQRIKALEQTEDCKFVVAMLKVNEKARSNAVYVDGSASFSASSCSSINTMHNIDIGAQLTHKGLKIYPGSEITAMYLMKRLKIELGYGRVKNPKDFMDSVVRTMGLIIDNAKKELLIGRPSPSLSSSLGTTR